MVSPGKSKENPITLSESDEDDEEELTIVEGSPMKVLSQPKYSSMVETFDEDSSEITAYDGTVRKKLKFDGNHRDKTDQPVYEIPPEKYSANKIIAILLTAKPEEVCRHKPLNIKKSSTFVVDVRCLKNQEDIKKDEFGIWQYSGSHPQCFYVRQKDDGYIDIEKHEAGEINNSHVMYLRRLHCVHPSNSNFKRLICFLSDSANHPHHLCLVVYRLPAGFAPKLACHGNAKKSCSKPFFATWPSTINTIKEECLHQGPKSTIEAVCAKSGGILHAAAPGQLPRNEKQVSVIAAKQKMKQKTKGSSVESDDLFVVMQRAHAEDLSSQFIRSIRATDPAIVIADDIQIADMVRFCTSNIEFGILTIDPTFCLGEFDVTPITYRHLLLETRRNGNIPVFVGPVLIHYRKNFGTYVFFASTLIGLSRQLQGVQAFGTDGEQALIDAFCHEFSFSRHLTCFIHVKRNIKEKCAECNLPGELSQQIQDDIFGRKIGGTYIEGLVDATKSDFDEKFDAIVESWQGIPLSSSTNLQKFVDWFITNKRAVICDTLSSSVRQECGLGCPPDPFTTNSSESINAALKRKVNYKKSKLPDFIDRMKEVIDEQQREVERAIIGRGKYKLRAQYSFLEIPETKWFGMSTQQRQKHLSVVNRTEVVGNKHDLSTSSVRDTYDLSLSVSCEDAAKHVTIPLKCLERILGKATQLLNSDGAIAPAPGQNSEARMVLSYSGKVPHLVVSNKTGDFVCDSNCPNWKGLGICSHSVVVAEVNGKLQEFLSAKKRRKPANSTNLIATNAPRGRGRKGGAFSRPRKHSEPIVTRVQMNIHGGSVSQSQSFDQSTSYHTVPSHLTPLSFMHSPLHGNQPSFSVPPFHYGYPPNLYGQSYPPLFPSQPLPSPPPTFTSPFTVTFIAGNISVCFGCKNKYTKNSLPPEDLCLKHQDWRQFTPTNGELQSKYSNVYYHCKLDCVWLCHPDFTASDIEITEDTKAKLNDVHKQYLTSVFGIDL